MSSFSQTPRNRVRRLPQRATYEREVVYAILDEALICHVSFCLEAQPYVIPTIHARDGDRLILHGAPASRLLKYVATGAPLSVAVTLLDGIVLARAVFHHSLNYRSVVLFGSGRALVEDEEKLRASEILTEHIARGRWADARPPNRKELDATHFVVLDIDSAAAKIRTGPPEDDDEDYDLPIWAGVLPLPQVPAAPQADPRLAAAIDVPDYVTGYRRR
jgi:nitroimidazol reductase NimA-like FMN-containing flavoprotein (pyridoxamine 5'-phosphate oxidase superfamily)